MKPCWRSNILIKNSARLQHSFLDDGFKNVSFCFTSQVPLSFLYLCGNSCFSLLCFSVFQHYFLSGHFFYQSGKLSPIHLGLCFHLISFTKKEVVDLYIYLEKKKIPLLISIIAGANATN